MMNQVLLGIFIPYTVTLLIYTAKRFRCSMSMLILSPVAMLVFALWAIAPDIPRVLGFDSLYDKLSRNPRCDIFFFHYTIDNMEINSPWYSAVFVLVLLSILFAAWRELRTRENI